MNNEFLHRLAGLFRRRAADRRIAEEAEFHLDMLTEKYTQKGLSPKEARLAARREFGGMSQMQEQYRDQSSLPALDSLWSDIVFGMRGFRKTPGVTLLIILTLGLGIGANTAIFSFLNELLLRPLPFREPGQLVNVGRNWKGESGATSPRDFATIRDKARSFSSVGTTFLHRGENVETPGRAQHAVGLSVSAGWFPTLGVQPLLGRTFTAEEDVPNGPKVVVLSYKLWESAFASDAGVLGRSLKLGGIPYTIVGVMPATSAATERARMWLPLQTTGTGNDTNYTMTARLAPGVTIQQAATEVETMLSEIDRENGYQKKSPEATSLVLPLHEAEASEFRRPVLLLYAGVCVVLFVACINVANLLLARSAARSKEIAVRAAIGAGRGRIIRQMLTESLLLAAIGGLTGLLLGQAFIWLLRPLAPYENFRYVTLDRNTLLFTMGVSLLVGILFGLAPAIHSLRVELIDTLKESSKSSPSRPALRGRQALVFCQVALCTVLLAGAGVFVRSVVNLRAVDIGFDAANLIIAPMTINSDKLTNKEAMIAFYDQAMNRVRSIPGVTDVAVTTQLPVQGQFNLPVVLIDSAEPERRRGLQFRIQSRTTFQTLGMRIVRGRDFQESDRIGSLPSAVVNEAFAQRFFRGEEVLGKRFRFASKNVTDVFTITGVVNDVREVGLRSPAPPVIYTVFEQTPQYIVKVVHEFVPAKWIVRVRPGVNSDVAGQIRREVGALDPAQPFQQFETMQSIVAQTMQMERLLMALLGAFALLTLVMVASGLYGTLAYAVTQRRQEIGIRMAMGAGWHNVVAMVAASGVSLVAGGVLLGVVASYWVTRMLSGLLFNVPALDPASLLASAGLLLVVSLLACAGPSLTAARTDPLRALRVD